MIFTEDNADLVLAGKKTMTRRRLSENTRSPWFKDRCGLTIGQDYAIRPGRNEAAIGRVEITSIAKEMLCRISDEDARREGSLSRQSFFTSWRLLHDGLNPFEYVWAVGFKLYVPAEQLEVAAHG